MPNASCAASYRLLLGLYCNLRINSPPDALLHLELRIYAAVTEFALLELGHWNTVAGNGQELCTHEDALTQVAHCGPCRFGQSEILFSTVCHGQFRTGPYAYSSYHVGN